MSVSKYAYAYARIRARMSDILSEGRLREFIDAKNKDDFLSSLTDTSYGERIAKAASTDIRSIEGALKEEIIEQYLMVIRSTKGKIRDVFEEIFRRLEVENLKSVIRIKATATVTVTVTEGAKTPLFFAVEDFFGRKISKLIEADSLESVIKQLEKPYKTVLEEAFSEFEKSKRVLTLENALDKEIFGAILRRIEKLRAEDKEIVRKIIGTEFDITNLMTLLRCKEEGIDEEEMRKYFLPYVYAFTFDFNSTDAKASISTKDLSSAIQLLPSSPYKEALTKAIPAYEAEKSLIPFENSLRKLFFSIIKNTLRGSPINIGTIIGFLYLKELEIRNLCTIAVCKENEISSDEILKFVFI